MGPALLLLLTLAFYWKLVSSQYIWFDHQDMCYIELPRLGFQAAEIHRMRFPLWDPYIWCGQPLIGQTQPGPLFPLNLLFCLLPLSNGYLRADCLNWLYIAIHFLAALFGYRLCRELGTGIVAAALAGCAFSFGGFMGTAPWLDVIDGAIWTPLIFVHVLRAVRGYRPASSAALSGLALGVAWLSGHHEIPLLVSGVVALTWLFFGLRDRGLLRWALLSFAIAGLIGAVQVWPTYEFGQLSQRWVGAENTVGWKDRIPYTIHTGYSLPASGILETVLPGDARHADTSPFLGVAVVALAALGALARWSDRRTQWLVCLLILSALYAIGAFSPLHGVIYSLSPVMAKARIPARALHLYDFAVAVLAGIGLDSLLRRESLAWARRLALSAGALGTLIVATAVVMAVQGRQIDGLLLLTGFCAGATGAIIASFGRQWLAGSVAAAALVVLMLTELTNLGPRRFPHVSEGKQVKFAGVLWGRRDIAEFLRAQPGPVRVAINDQDVPENFGDWHRVEMLQGYVAAVPDNLVTRYGLHTKRAQWLFGVTHSMGRQPHRPDQEEVFKGASGVKVFRNPNPMPRAWAAHEAIGVRDVEQLDALIQDPQFDFRKRVVILGEAPRLEPCADETDVQLVRHSANRVTIAARLACRGMVILGDSYYPGWEAQIDGKAAEVREVFGAMRGVVVDAGEHTVEMRFRPVSVFGGAALSLAGLLATLAIVVRGRGPTES